VPLKKSYDVIKCDNLKPSKEICSECCINIHEVIKKQICVKYILLR